MPVDIEGLLKPISEESPCGADLDEESALGAFDALRVFGSRVPLDTRHEKGLGPEIQWRDVRALAEDALARSKDMRPLAHLAASAVRLEGIEALAEVLEAASGWLETFWDGVYPRIADDAVARSNALECLADRMAIVDAVRRAPLLAHKPLGAVTYRDIEAAGRATEQNSSESAITGETIAAIFEAVPMEDLTSLEGGLARGSAALAAIEARMAAGTDNRSVPDLAPLADLLRKAQAAVAKHAAPRRAAEQVAAESGSSATAESAGSGLAASHHTGAPVGAIRSRQDAMRALDAIAEFFRRNEPSSPVPLFIERTKRMISMSFIELLAEIVPDSVDPAKLAAGVRDAEA